MIRIFVIIFTLSFVACKTQKAVTFDTVENNSTTATQQSQKVESTATEISSAKIIVNDISEMVTEVSVIDYDSVQFKPVKETTIRQTIKRNAGSVTEQKRESKQDETGTSSFTEQTTAKTKETHKAKPTLKGSNLFLKFVLAITIGFLFADLVQNFPKRIQFFKKILGLK